MFNSDGAVPVPSPAKPNDGLLNMSFILTISFQVYESLQKLCGLASVQTCFDTMSDHTNYELGSDILALLPVGGAAIRSHPRICTPR